MRFVVSLLLIATLVSCRTAQKTPVNTPSATAAAPATPPPPPAKSEPKKVALILGPGGAKALASVGVLRAFQIRRIPIDKIVGLEWGSLIAALYANKGLTHDAEWKLYKMQQRNLPLPKGFFAKRLGENSIKIMDDFLDDSFGKDTINEARVPFECPTRTVWTGVVGWQDRGDFRDVIKKCLPFPPIFKAQGTFIAGASQVSEAVERLRGQGFNVIILVNVLSNAQPVGQDSLLENLNYAILWQEVKRSLVQAEKLGIDVIHVDTNTIPMVQFESAKELTTIGEAAGLKAADALITKYGF